ncbi:MAG: hypothetical protein B6D43_07335 [Ignavibacteriales bacterium UTCHB1]|jgi:S-adenosylmethionine:tRNA ribosyltransferase-isomerase|nr:S-adenosylmethionine:tRNA ribosyltransferase-isomerase [Ignavibacteria bacterium]OQY77418.1 MAG: hypothetical protein B6D43_07335 [Ignavibacteriales bacterium UTCHB1]
METAFLNANEFIYNLPDEKIALYPLAVRSDSKLLVYKKGKITDRIFHEILDEFQRGDLLVFNNSKVIPARMFFDSGRSKPIEILMLKPVGNKNFTDALNDKSASKWECIVGNMRKWKTKILHKEIHTGECKFTLSVEIVDRNESFFILEFRWNNANQNFGDILDLNGLTPLPPYIRRNTTSRDKERYQTVYAKQTGSVAAPTAGLHFTNNLIRKIVNSGVNITELTLHVGAGTFKPILVDNVFNHKMHSEFVTISKTFLLALLNAENEVITIGTTSLRSLESVKLLGAKLNSGIPGLHVMQEDGLRKELIFANPFKSYENLLNYLEKNSIDEITFETSLMIYPGYNLNTCKALITNFHQPSSTLLLIIAAILGENWKILYDYALKNDYRFLSYGDSSLIYIG